MFTTPTVVGEVLYVGSCSGIFYALDAGSGEARWTYDTRDDGDPAQFHGNPVITDELVVTPSDSTIEGFTYAFDRATGKLVWKQPTDGGGGIVTDLLQAGDTAVGVTKSGDLVSLGLGDGFPRWSFSPASYEHHQAFRSPNPAMAGERILFGGADGAAYAVDAASGEQLWKLGLGARITTGLAVHGEHLYLGLEDHRFVRLAVADGAVAGVLPLDGPAVGFPVAADNVVVVLTGYEDASAMVALDAALDGELWRHTARDAWTSVRPLLWHGTVLAGSNQGVLSAFALADGKVDWTLTLEGRLRGLGSAGDLLYVGTIDGTLYAVETVGATARPAAPPPERP